MSRFDPAWLLMRLNARLRRSELRHRARGEGGARRGVLRALQGLNSALIHLLAPGVEDPWFTEGEARQANRERTELLGALAGHVHLSAGGSKPHIGPLSPGCAICMDGYWGCNYITSRCQRNCFYCLRDHSMETNADPRTDGFTLRTPAEHVSFLRTFRIRGVGFSGGEPLLARERLLSHITAIRKEFGRAIYLWMYTNGDLADREALGDLRDAGLDEIRLDLSARGYDLSPLVLAREYIPTVTVEIPAIPEDFDLLKGLLPDMQAIGVNHLSLHQLLAGERNWRAFCRRHYHLSCERLWGVHESELCALRLLLHACEQRLNLPINYCALAYRLRFYARALRLRSALASLQGFQEVTEAGYVRTMHISDSPDGVQAMLRRMEEDRVDPGLWQHDTEHGGVALHGSLLRYVDWSSATLTITYARATAVLENKRGGFDPGNLKLHQHEVKAARGLGRVAFECWRRLYADRETAGRVFGSVAGDVADAPAGGSGLTEGDCKQLRDLARCELLPTGLPEIT